MPSSLLVIFLLFDAEAPSNFWVGFCTIYGTNESNTHFNACLWSILDSFDQKIVIKGMFEPISQVSSVQLNVFGVLFCCVLYCFAVFYFILFCFCCARMILTSTKTMKAITTIINVLTRKQG